MRNEQGVKMAKRRTPTSQAEGRGKVEKVMHEFKEGTLRSSAGPKVTNRKQAIAIALSEQRRARG